MSLKSNRAIVIILGIPGILLLTWLGGITFSAFMTIVMLLAITEFYQIAKLKGHLPVYIFGWFATIVIALYYYNPNILDITTTYALIVGFIIVVLFTEMFRNKPNPTENFGITLSGILYVPLLLGSFIAIRNFDSANATNFTFALFISVWICDSAAFIGGKYLGNKKIYPRVSPNKTIVGSISGLIFSFITYYVMNEIGFIKFDLNIEQLTILSIITGVFGQAGDFAESLFKRDAKVKDSSNFLLGHGGVLDRFDSLTIASPLVLIFLKFYY